MTRHRVIIKPGGTVCFLHDDRLAALYTAGPTHLRRVSHVEPTADNQWTADMGPVNGPVLGPFPTRGAALQAERDWLGARLATLR
jgi:hypothetical protein